MDENDSDRLDSAGYKIYSEIETDQIDRYAYKRAFVDKKKLHYKAKVAESILAALAKEASGQETNC